MHGNSPACTASLVSLSLSHTHTHNTQHTHSHNPEYCGGGWGGMGSVSSSTPWSSLPKVY